MSNTEASESFPAALLGVHDRHHFILEAPKRADRSLVEVREGETWVFRALYHRTALRFQAPILRVAVEPLPHLHVQLPQYVERRTVPGAARVPVALRATILHSQMTPAVIADLSVGGVRVAVAEASSLATGQNVTFSISLTINDRLYALDLKALVLARDPATAGHPGIEFYRMQFESLPDTAFLTLQAYLGTVIAEELDGFWRMVVDPRA